MLSFKEEAFSAFAIDILTGNDYDISDSVFCCRISYQIKYPVASGIFDMKWLRNGEIRRRVRVMSISMIGIDHNMAPVDIRAKFAFTKKNAGEAMEK